MRVISSDAGARNPHQRSIAIKDRGISPRKLVEMTWRPKYLTILLFFVDLQAWEFFWRRLGIVLRLKIQSGVVRHRVASVAALSDVYRRKRPKNKPTFEKRRWIYPSALWHWWIAWACKERLGSIRSSAAQGGIIAFSGRDVAIHAKTWSTKTHEETQRVFLRVPSCACVDIYFTSP